MADYIIDKIKFKRGLKANLPVLEDGEPAYCTDTKEYFIGTSNGNKLINDLSEVLALRTGANGTVYATAKERADAEYNKVTTDLAQKATKDELNNLGHLQLNGTYATLTDLQTAYPSGTTGLYLVTADGYTYRWDGSAWVQAAQFQSTGIAAESLTKDKFKRGAISPVLTDFATTGKNLYNKDAAIKGYALNSTGLVENSIYYTSEYIPVEPNTEYSRVREDYYTWFYDESFNGISYSKDVSPFTTPANCKYIRISNYETTIGQEQLEKGAVNTSYEPYQVLFPKYNVPREPFVDYDTYPFQPFATLNDTATKAIVKKAIKRIEVYGADPTKKYALGFIQREYSTYGTGIYIAECNSDGSFNKYVARTNYTSYAIPSGVTVFEVASLEDYGITAKVWIDWNEVPTNSQYVTNTYNKGGLDYRTLIQPPQAEVIGMSLPSVLNAVVGDTLEVFYKGIIQAVNPFDFNIKVVSSKGNAYKNRWIYKPTSAVADFPLTISVYDNQNNLLTSKTATVKTSAVKPSPSTLKNVLCIGDSLTNGGVWVRELDRRLTLTGGSPEGHGLTNIDFIGTQLNNDTGYEGYGGWGWTNYNSSSEPPYYWVTVTSGMKTDPTSEQSIWSDGTNQWQLETIDTTNNKIKFKQYPDGGSYDMPASGTLTFVSGGGDTTDIVFSSSEAESTNPFWNVATNQLDFVKYCNDNGYSGIDYCFILLGWNHRALTGAELVTEGKKFVDALKVDYPNVKVGILGLQVPSIDGMGANYGSHDNWNYYEVIQDMVFEFNKAYEDWTKETGYSDYMSFIHVSSQFDTENNMPKGTRQVNTRNSTTEEYGTNGVHPATSGYYQIADTVYRKLMSLL